MGGAPIPIQPDFNNLANVWEDINPVGTSEGSYSPTLSAPACPSASGGWTVNGNVALPRLDPSIISSVASEPQQKSNQPAPRILPARLWRPQAQPPLQAHPLAREPAPQLQHPVLQPRH